MFKTMFTKGSIPVLEKAINFHAERHKVITQNIANVMTPYYQAKDLPADEFYSKLRSAIEDRRKGNPRFFNYEPSRNIRLDGQGNLQFNVVSSGEVNILRHDRNNVDVDMEMSKLGKNTLMHNALVEMLNHQFRMIQSAISERVT